MGVGLGMGGRNKGLFFYLLLPAAFLARQVLTPVSFLEAQDQLLY